MAHPENKNCFRHLKKKLKEFGGGCPVTASLVCLELIEGDIYLYNTEYPLRNDNYMIQTNNYGIFQATAANTIFPP
ncbi:MAG: hypothetical protein KJ555_13875, partial [Proteobacteria bacterium]|nr:hypothetical protein [Pseudomonadota bacterium]